MAKRFSHQMSKTFHICKWISFAISTFVIVEETPSALTQIVRKSCFSMIADKQKSYPDLIVVIAC